MGASTTSLPRPIMGVGGVLLIVSLFLPWGELGAPAELAGLPSPDTSATGWELLSMSDVFLLIVGTVAIVFAITGTQIGVFRPDVSLKGAADLLGVVATTLIAWLVIFDFPDGASREVGVFLALAAAITVAGGAGDYSVLRGAPLFPRIKSGEREDF